MPIIFKQMIPHQSDIDFCRKRLANDSTSEAEKRLIKEHIKQLERSLLADYKK
jgi:hypothetical protein